MVALVLRFGYVTLGYEYHKNVLIGFWEFFTTFAFGKTECIIRS